jgi:hypothetical protein
LAQVLSALLHQPRFLRDLASPIWADALAAHRNANASAAAASNSTRAAGAKRPLTAGGSTFNDVSRQSPENGRSAAASYDLTVYSAGGSISSSSSSSSSSTPAVRDGRLAWCLLGVVRAFVAGEAAATQRATQRALNAQTARGSGGTGTSGSGGAVVAPLAGMLDLSGLKREVARVSGRFGGSDQQVIENRLRTGLGA